MEVCNCDKINRVAKKLAYEAALKKHGTDVALAEAIYGRAANDDRKNANNMKLHRIKKSKKLQMEDFCRLAVAAGIPPHRLLSDACDKSCTMPESEDVPPAIAPKRRTRKINKTPATFYVVNK